MKKVFLQDIVPAGKRSIRNIPLPSSKSIPTERPIENSREKVERPKNILPPQKPPTRRQKTSSPLSSVRIWVAAAALVLLLAYASSFLFVSATVTVTPKEITVPVAIFGTASVNPVADGLAFTVVTLSREASKEIPASGQESVTRKASGKIVIYNDYNKEPQKLIANTRFESSDGLIYRIQQAVTVPGQKVTGGVTTPGSLAVTVYADQAGEKYNIGLSDFTIPGFKDDPRYTKITAKSDPAAPLNGGFVGTLKKVAPADSAAAKVAIEAQLKNELRQELESQIPDSHILFNNAYTFNFTELPQGVTMAANESPSTATAKEKGSIYGILFERAALSKYMAEHSTEIGAKDVSVENLSSVSFTLDKKEAFDPEVTKSITFKLTGDTKFVWNLQNAEVKKSLAGQKRASIKGILANFEAIDRANVAIRPAWIFTMPKSTDKITVEIAGKE